MRYNMDRLTSVVINCDALGEEKMEPDASQPLGSTPGGALPPISYCFIKLPFVGSILDNVIGASSGEGLYNTDRLT